MRATKLQPLAGSLVNQPGENCANCKFSVASNVGDHLVCRRWPPVLTLLAIPLVPRGVVLKENEVPQVTFGMQAIQPLVQPADWCGEWTSSSPAS